MTIIKKIAFMVLIALLVLFTACEKSSSEITSITTTEMVSPATTTVLISTVLQLPWEQNFDWRLETADLKALFEVYQNDMLTLVELLDEQNVVFAEITRNYFEATDGAGNHISLKNAFKEKFQHFHRTIEAEANYGLEIFAGKEKGAGKRVITFAFGSADNDVRIKYMPDGYVKSTHPVPSIDPQESEVQLAENWYSYLY